MYYPFNYNMQGAQERGPHDDITEIPGVLDIMRARKERLATVIFPQVLDGLSRIPWYSDEYYTPKIDARDVLRKTLEGAQGWECDLGVVANLSTVKIIDGAVTGLLLASYNEAARQFTLQETDTAGTPVVTITFEPAAKKEARDVYDHLTIFAPNDRGKVVPYSFHGSEIYR